MGYMHINNLYKDQRVLMFKEVFVMEKVHGTSAHIRWQGGQLGFFSGGASHDVFTKIFDHALLTTGFTNLGLDDVTVYGEAYGGKEQGMRETYGPDLRFIAFDVKVGDHFVDVPNMDQIAGLRLGLDVVPWTKVECTIENLDRHRDNPSIVASIRGCGPAKLREGIVVRPLMELTDNRGERVMCKHKGEAFSERIHTPKVKPDKLEVIAAAEAIATEWVTEMRLSHVLDKLEPKATELKDIPRVNDAMLEDVYREAKGEIVESKEAAGAIKKLTAQLYKKRVTAVIA